MQKLEKTTQKNQKFNIAVLGVRKSIFRGKVVVIQIYAIRFIATLERNKNAHFIICTKRNIGTITSSYAPSVVSIYRIFGMTNQLMRSKYAKKLGNTILNAVINGIVKKMGFVKKCNLITF